MRLAASTPTLYLRHDGLTREDRRDLERYLALLRQYYEIPADQPVFPKAKQARPAEHRTVKQPRREATRNRADHPWRASLGGRQQ